MRIKFEPLEKVDFLEEGFAEVQDQRDRINAETEEALSIKSVAIALSPGCFYTIKEEELQFVGTFIIDGKIVITFLNTGTGQIIKKTNL